MTNNEIKIQALKTAITRTKHGVTRINDVIRDVNAVWTNNGEPYPLPVGEYKRRAWLMADLTRMLDQIQKEVIEADLAAGRPVCEETGRDLREWCGNDIEAAHVEALAMNNQADFFALEWTVQYLVIEAAEDEAIQINTMMDTAWPLPVSVFIEGCHEEALEMNAALNEERRIAEVTRAEFYLHNAVVQRDHFIPKAHAEALAMDATYNAIIADRNATLELSGALGRDVLQKSIVMLKCQTVGEVSGEVKEGDTVTASLQDQNGNKITITGEVEEILE